MNKQEYKKPEVIELSSSLTNAGKVSQQLEDTTTPGKAKGKVS